MNQNKEGMKSIVITACVLLSIAAQGQTNIFPTNGNATINDGSLIQTGNNNISTQGALKLKNYLLLDSDGDFTGDNYYTIQDHPSGGYLRLGRGFSSDMVIDANGRVGIGTLAPTAKLEVSENLAVLNGAEKLYWASKHVGNSDHRSYLAPRLSDNSGWDWNQEFGYHNYYRSWYFKGNVGIGVLNPGSKLAVNGNIRAKEIKVETANWPDYVFEPGYELPSLKAIKKHIQENGRLPNIPSANEIEANGLELGEMNRLLLEKTEELTLILIEKDREIRALKTLESRIAAIEAQIK